MQLDTSLWRQQDHIVVAVSTGVDSMVLLHQLLTTYRKSYREITCLHVNHGLRKASQQEAEFIESYCAEKEIPLYVKQLDLSDTVAKGISIEQTAREARYRWFDAMMPDLNADCLLTAHHEDDQLETIFYRLFSGRSTRSSLGIEPLSERDGYQLIRPMLSVPKRHIYHYQQQHDVPYFEDHTNQDNTYVRNDIRNRILPTITENEHLDVTQLLKLKAWHDEQRQALQQEVSAFIKHHATVHPSKTEIALEREAFNNLRYSVKVAVLDYLMGQQDGVHHPFSEKTYQAWFEQAAKNIAQVQLYTTDKWIIELVYDKFVIMEKNEVEVQSQQLEHAGSYAFGHYEIQIKGTMSAVTYPLTVRTKREGDRFKLNGQSGHKKVNRLFIDHKIPRHERPLIPIVTTKQGAIIAVGTLFKDNDYRNDVDIKYVGDEQEK
ncbi:tRNA(Ile)-lysidine synthase [Staphylococcus auricularis]|mgnify:FL=1|uniref:tRNA(Ile)-lysidine synthase n=1 Tax=Staphylococcus auricularis TaxID=29379 RepID=A0AAP8PNY2_9STAP|nr:tRNA lysidine(34) synthetase TilS [Staphylococcus auricularis]MBM0868686.1 tRNA lysidine(34) synthetase TilS [Staphylococcus auricularis]MCG7342298.1 tRNA lysidine(34) synthetase TilS [Staphylococcus auricularis]MDC6328144.1 tRNA lysidine(34) synthetase TilS [Staphylococcus auricularis]MDN4532089.1 tRNA lysidine(34) synthetase TilS [Staphylococcus auricularis]PNZ67522.1 tRNA lysidine(34) synthetase TilS [Staphylococcus auricularis]